MGTTDEENKTENNDFDWSSLGGEFKMANKGFDWSRKPYKPVLSQEMEEKKRADQAQERDLVLAQIEYREDTDPNYHRPDWISKDKTSMRRRDGVTSLTEGERYLGQNEKLFEKSVEHFFPRPRDH